MTEAIEGFTGHYEFLTTTHKCKFVWGGIEWPTVEHAFQAAKSENELDHIRISKLETAEEAIALGNKLKCRPDWDTMKDWLMYTILMHKFRQNPQLIDELLQTDYMTLLNINDKGDAYWGVSNGAGLNKLGKALMQLRNWFRVLEFVFCLQPIEKTRND